MGSSESLGGFQELVMLSVLRLGDDAYGATIQRDLEKNAKRSVSISTIYVTMARLEKKKLVESWLADPTPVRGGRSKRFYKLSRAGLRALRDSRQANERMWKSVKTHPLLRSP